jgi:hypothetical protein
MINSQPFLEGFNPYIIPMQGEFIDLLENWDYAKSTLEVMLSGAYGSSKSIVVAHFVILHCLNNRGACVFIGRRSLPDLKKTFFNELCEHLVTPSLKEGIHYRVNYSRGEIYFPATGSKIISGSWADRKYKKFRSLKLSVAVFEEAAENDLEDREAFMSVKARLRRLPHVRQSALIVITNPDTPEHWLYEYFCEGSLVHDSRRVLYSVTSDNPFLDPIYMQQLLNDLSPREVERYIYGRWISLIEEVIYSTYEQEHNFSNTNYEINHSLPIGITFDFNIGEGKPLSAALFQYDDINDHFHFFDESVIYSARTENSLEDMESRGLLNNSYTYKIFGDAMGKHKDTRSKRSDYDIIYEYLDKLNIKYEKCVLPSNPPIKTRHNLVRGYCLNGLGKRRLTVYKKCKMLDKGLKLTKLKKGAGYVEDDSKACPWQHITTSLGYAVHSIYIKKKSTNYQRNL